MDVAVDINRHRLFLAHAEEGLSLSVFRLEVDNLTARLRLHEYEGDVVEIGHRMRHGSDFDQEGAVIQTFDHGNVFLGDLLFRIAEVRFEAFHGFSAADRYRPAVMKFDDDVAAMLAIIKYS